MGKIKPIRLELKYGLVIGLALLLITVFTLISKWEDVSSFFIPSGELLNWRFVFLLIVLFVVITWFIMNSLWISEIDANKKLQEENKKTNEDLQLKIENIKELLKLSEIEYLSDPITGVPNVRRLEKDFGDFFLNDKKPLLQFVFIDLKNFGEINKTFLSQKTNRLIRNVAQDIYLGMRRNESMFKFPASTAEKKSEGNFYRIFPGGDEFVFIIGGDQSEALGFINRLRDKFEELSKSTKLILGEIRNLSFYCSIVQVDAKDKNFEDIFERAEICYRTVWFAAKSDFAITWYPTNFEAKLSEDPRKKDLYKRSKENFEYIPIIEDL
ncbi:diguanylate cyclase domain-containing protein [Persicitalea jodogahamensis]|uniref:GGDEF domain-containing protein n=1 Tax=Persicitalea jodogahamensis TaxID=402147 RepID=A0A8J3D334_9BACT|nr:diguanylate cyclase [Persicitalea jodogahamensis]GHB64807.1 hypothetical protein GCM10007390_18520 [Persicitalea jodogahamensis]